MQKLNRYTYRLTWSEEDQEYVGSCVEFPSLSWLDKDENKAFQGIRNLVNEVVSEMTASGEPVPEALSSKKYSGNISARVTPIVHRNLAIEAAEKGVSMNRLISVKLAMAT